MQQSRTSPFDDTALRKQFGAATLVRGSSYAQSGRVLEWSVDESGVLSGAVMGSAGRRYLTSVMLVDEVDVAFEAYCTCPVGIDCKHAAALLLAARGQPAGPAPVDRQADWERSLAEIVQPSSSVETPLGLQFEVTARQRRSSAYPHTATSSVSDRRIRLRPVTPGATGAWIRSGTSWREVRYRGGLSGAQQAALRELLVSYEAHNLSPYGSYGGDLVFLDEFGPGLWRLLEQAVGCGVALVPVGKKAGPVVLSPRLATVSFDLTVDGRGEATMTSQMRLGDTPLEPSAVDFLGSPPHGIAVHGDDGLLLAPFDRPMTKPVSRLVQDLRSVRIPAGDLDRFVGEYYPRIRRLVSVTSPDGSVDLPEIAPPKLSLTLTYHDRDRMALEWGFEYAVRGESRTYPIASDADDDLRDQAAEQALVRDLAVPDGLLPYLRSDVLGLRRFVSPLILTGMDAVRFLDEALPPLQELPEVVVRERGQRPEFRAAEGPPQVRLRTADSDDPDWFDLQISVVVDGEDVPLDALLTALTRGEDHLLLASGVWFDLDRPELQQLRRLIEEARDLLEADGDQIRLSRYQAGFWDELCQLGVVAEQSERWAESVRGLVEADGPEQLAAPPTLAAELRPYQLDGYRWLSFLWDQGLGGILADDMGLGKTVQSLALLCRAKDAERLAEPTLVVAPTSVVRNWVNEAGKFAPDLRVVSVSETGSRRGRSLPEVVAGMDVVVTSYALFRMEFDDYAALTWSGLILDEAQFVKNHQAKTYQCARRLQAPFKLAITGTPMENNLMELWALLSIVAPGLFPSPQKFTEFYRRPIERGADPGLLTSLRRRIRPLMRRCTKEQVAAELPPKQEQVLEVDLHPRHRKIYDTRLQRERQKILGLLDDFDKHRFTVLKSLTLLRQLSLDAALVDEQHASVPAAKVDVLLEHLAELVAEGHRALVFSQFTSFLRRIRDKLDAAGVAHCYLDGSTRNREAVINSFKSGDTPVFLISLKAGGVGLNLTEADYCFVLDPWWNPATEAQAVDRTHRIGQDKTVVVYRLVSTNTIEEKVMALKKRKAELFGSVLGEDGVLSGPLGAEDIKALLEP